MGEPVIEPVLRYAAFISYSHADDDVGVWLHRRLESYRVPDALVGRVGPRGVIGKRLGKFFRDRVELSAGHDLGAEIRRALELSDALIVLCSPNSMGSRYVEQEIRYFKQLGRGNRIFAAIVSGEPHASRKPGWDESEECFPPALIYRVLDDGAVSNELETNEPIAADFRDGKDGYERASLKLIAGLISVGLDELLMREAASKRRTLYIRGAIAAAFLAVIGIAAFAAQSAVRFSNLSSENQRLAQENSALAQSQRERANASLREAIVRDMWQLYNQGQTFQAAQIAIAGAGRFGDLEPDARALLLSLRSQSGGARALCRLTSPDRPQLVVVTREVYVDTEMGRAPCQPGTLRFSEPPDTGEWEASERTSVYLRRAPSMRQYSIGRTGRRLFVTRAGELVCDLGDGYSHLDDAEGFHPRYIRARIFANETVVVDDPYRGHMRVFRLTPCVRVFEQQDATGQMFVNDAGTLFADLSNGAIRELANGNIVASGLCEGARSEYGIWNGEAFIAICANSTVSMFQTPQSRVMTLQTEHEAIDIVFSTSGQSLAVINAAGDILVWRRNGQRRAKIRANAIDPFDIAFLDEQAIVVLNSDGTVREHAFAPATLRELGRVPAAASDIVRAGDNRHLVITSPTGRAWVWDMQTSRIMRERGGMPSGDAISEVHGRDGARTVDTWTTVWRTRWDLDTGEVEVRHRIADLVGPPMVRDFRDELERDARLGRLRPIDPISFARSDRFLTTSENNGRVTIWDAATARPIEVNEGDDRRRWATLAPDDSVLIVSEDGRIWRRDTQQLRDSYRDLREWACAFLRLKRAPISNALSSLFEDEAPPAVTC